MCVSFVCYEGDVVFRKDRMTSEASDYEDLASPQPQDMSNASGTRLLCGSLGHC